MPKATQSCYSPTLKMARRWIRAKVKWEMSVESMIPVWQGNTLEGIQ